MIIVTGGSGFIGSNLIHSLNKIGFDEILVIDDLSDGRKLINLFSANISDIRSYIDIDEILQSIPSSDVEAIFHLGACSDTMEWDGNYIMNVNYQFSKKIMQFALSKQIAFIYASSASVYGKNKSSVTNPKNEKPINVYAYSKLLFDQYVRTLLPTAKSQIVGLRYFNVYGPNEQHKETMASVVYHFYNQVIKTGRLSIFGSYNEIKPGEHSRDFVHVYDTVIAKLWFMKNKEISGIFNIGTGNSFTYNSLAGHICEWFEQNKGIVTEQQYVPFPEKLKGSYQDFTCADLSLLRKVGFNHQFLDLKEGVYSYLDALQQS